METLRTMGRRWKQYEKEGKWKYQQHPFWCSGYTFVSCSVASILDLTFQWDLPSEAPDLFNELAEADLVFFKGDLNFRKLSFDCHLPHTTPFATAIGPMASTENAPAICSLRTIKSDVVAGIPEGVGERLDEEEPGWKISGKYVSTIATRPQ